VVGLLVVGMSGFSQVFPYEAEGNHEKDQRGAGQDSE
jgi:hypothetical protein